MKIQILVKDMENLKNTIQKDLDRKNCSGIPAYIEEFNELLAQAKKKKFGQELKSLVDVPDINQGFMSRGSSEDHAKMREIFLSVNKLIARAEEAEDI